MPNLHTLKVSSFIRENVRLSMEKRISAFLNGYRQNIGMLGSNGLGKTQTLLSLVASLKGRSALIPVYIQANVLDYDEWKERYIGALLEGLFISQSVEVPQDVTALQKAAEPIIPRTVQLINHVRRSARQDKLSASFKELLSLSDSLSHETGKKVILMIDDFHLLERLPIPDPFGALGRQIMIDKNTLFVVASSNPIKAREIFRDRLSLLFGNFEILEIQPFQFEESEAFLKLELSDIQLTHSQNQLLHYLCYGYPFYLKIFTDQLRRLRYNSMAESSVIWNANLNIVPDELLIESITQEMYDEYGRLSMIFERWLEAIRRLGKDSASYIRTLIAVSQGRHKAVSIAAYVGKRTKDIKLILQRLIQERWVVKYGSFYILENRLFSFWLKEVCAYRIHWQPILREGARLIFAENLKREVRRFELWSPMQIGEQIQVLFKEFRGDVIDYEQKRIKLPCFSEVIMRSEENSHWIISKNQSQKWFSQFLFHYAQEEDVIHFTEELKRNRKKIQRKILILPAGIEQNAKLIAQQAGIQIWDLAFVNTLLALYDKPPIAWSPVRRENESNESVMGSMEKSLHTA